MYTIHWKKKASKQLSKLAPMDRHRVAHAVTVLADFPNAENVKTLINHTYAYRLRVGNYRVMFDVDTEIRIVDIQEVKKRDGNTY